MTVRTRPRRVARLGENNPSMVAVAQLAEHPVVIRKVAGSSPVGHPKE